MTSNRWLQIALFGSIVVVITRPFGGYMGRVFAGERVFLSPLLRPVKRLVYLGCGVEETEEQSWRTKCGVDGVLPVAGFVTLYALQRLSGIYRSTRSGIPARYNRSATAIIDGTADNSAK